LAAIAPENTALLSAALTEAGEPILSIVGRLDVVELAKLSPDLLVADLDQIQVDPFEMLRRIRFVLPNCVVAVYTAASKLSWGRECHLAGANCLLSKNSQESELATGLRSAIRSGCFTDPRLVA